MTLCVTLICITTKHRRNNCSNIQCTRINYRYCAIVLQPTYSRVLRQNKCTYRTKPMCYLLSTYVPVPVLVVIRHLRTVQYQYSTGVWCARPVVQKGLSEPYTTRMRGDGGLAWPGLASGSQKALHNNRQTISGCSVGFRTRLVSTHVSCSSAW